MRRLATIAAATLLAGGALAGCGISHSAGASKPDAAHPRASCGSAATHFLDDRTQLLSASPGALSCFDAAARHCRAASISVLAMGVDAGTHYVFVIKPGGRPCQVTELSQFYIVTGGVHRNPVTSTRCRVAVVTAQGVTLRCDGQAIVVPAVLSHREAAT